MSKANRLLLVDDDLEFHKDFRSNRILRLNDIKSVYNEEGLKTALKAERYDIILLDLQLEDGDTNKDGLERLDYIKKRHKNLPVIIVTGAKDPSLAFIASGKNAAGYFYKEDYEASIWQQEINKAIHEARKLSRLVKKAKQKTSIPSKEVIKTPVVEEKQYEFIGESIVVKKAKQLLEEIGKDPNKTALIRGETGTGKEVAARYLHQKGNRRKKNFIAVNLSAIPRELLESTLFGQRKGGFTGATKDIQGYFEQANGGTLLLDEIGDVDAQTQVKLLRLVETKRIRPVGASQEKKVNVQIILATHKNLEEMVFEGTFRLDLFQRLRTFTINLPPLRERREDIKLLLQYALSSHLKEQVPLNELNQFMKEEVIQYCLQKEWIGNIRELVGDVEYMILQQQMQKKKLIDMACLPKDSLFVKPISSKPVLGTSDTLQKDISSVVNPISNNAGLSIEQQQAKLALDRIESLMVKYNSKIKDIATEMNLVKNGSDKVRYKIKKYYKNHPELVKKYPRIMAKYAKTLSKIKN